MYYSLHYHRLHYVTMTVFELYFSGYSSNCSVILLSLLIPTSSPSSSSSLFCSSFTLRSFSLILKNIVFPRHFQASLPIIFQKKGGATQERRYRFLLSLFLSLLPLFLLSLGYIRSAVWFFEAVAHSFLSPFLAFAFFFSLEYTYSHIPLSLLQAFIGLAASSIQRGCIYLCDNCSFHH